MVAVIDSNLPDIGWSSHSSGTGRVGNIFKRQYICQQVLDIFDTQLVHGPTHYKGNTLVFVFLGSELMKKFHFKYCYQGFQTMI